MINGVPQSKEEYDAIINPDEHTRRMNLIAQGVNSAKANNVRKVRMLERMAWKKKKIELSDKFGI